MKRPMIEPCAEWAELLAAVSLADLSPAAQAALKAHLVTCPACAAVKAEYQRMDARIRALPSVRPLDGLPPALVQLWAEENQPGYVLGRAFSARSKENSMRIREEKNVPIPTPNAQPQNRHMRRLVSGISAVAAVALVAVVVTALVISHNAKSTKTGNSNTSSSTQTWQALPSLTNTPGLPVIAPSNPQVVYEAQFSRANLPASVTLRRSDNDGATWQNLPLPAGITQVNFAGFFVSPLAAQNVFVEFNAPCATAQAQTGAQVSAYSSGANICTSDYFSTNGGASWSRVQWPVHGGNTSQIRMGGFYTYSPFKAQGTRLYALLSVGSTGIESSFVTSTDGGATWKFADQSLAAAGNCMTDYAATPTGSTVFAIVARCNPGNAHLDSYTSKNNPASPAAGGGGNQLWRSDNAGASWAAVGDFAGGNAGPNLHVSLNSAGQPVLYDDGFVPITITPSNDLYPSQVSSVTKVSTDGGKTWQAVPQVNGQFANSSILGITSDGSIIEAFTDTVNSNKKHQLISQLFSWKAGDTAWHQLSGDFPGESQYVLAVSSGDSGHDTLWLVTSVGSAYSVQRLSL